MSGWERGLSGALGLVVAVAMPALAQDQAPERDPTPRLAVVSAFDPELEALLAAMKQPEAEVINNIRFTTGELEGRDVVLFLSGVSMTNAAMTTQMALDTFAIEAIVFSGIAGGVDPELKIGDVVVPAKWSPYLDVFMARDVEGEYVLPGFFTPELPNYGMMYPRGVRVFADGEQLPERRFWFETDPLLLDVALRLSHKIELAGCVSETECLETVPEMIVGGNGVSGPAFVDNADFRTYVFETFDARVLDMESAAVAQVAFTNEVPFIAFRSLSDLAGGGEGENEIMTFLSLAATNAAAVVRAFLRELPDD